MKPIWLEGNAVDMLINGEEFFPRVFDRIRQAREEVLLETFIVLEDKVGKELQQALICAAHNGAHVEVIVDGYGTVDLSNQYLSELRDAGVNVHVFDPKPRLLGMRMQCISATTGRAPNRIMLPKYEGPSCWTFVMPASTCFVRPAGSCPYRSAAITATITSSVMPAARGSCWSSAITNITPRTSKTITCMRYARPITGW